MSYRYEDLKSWILTDEGQRLCFRTLASAQALIKSAGACMSGKLIGADAPSTWHSLAAIDRLIEVGELREVTNSDVAGQHRIFVAAK